MTRMAAATKKPPIVEYEVYVDWGDKFVFKAQKGSIFICNGEWIAIPNAQSMNNRPIAVPKERVKYIVTNGMA